jgi:leader peptidase (prepilin peptidase) / N-methyltransferase
VVLVIGCALVCGVAAYLLGPWLLARIPEPELEKDRTKPLYVSLAGRRAAIWCGVLAMIAGGLIGWQIGWSPPLAAWLVLAVVGAILCYIDLRTKYLPSAIIWPAYGVVAVLLVAASAASGDWHALLRAVVAGAVTFALFWVLWWVYPAGLGFGDVRLSGLLGGALGWLGWAEVITGVYGGFLLGAILGLVLVAFKVFERKAFAFGPFMLAGALVGVLIGNSVAGTYLS